MIPRRDEDRDPDFVGAEKAIKRAAWRARRLAFQTDTPLAIYRDGKVIKKRVTAADLELPLQDS